MKRIDLINKNQFNGTNYSPEEVSLRWLMSEIFNDSNKELPDELLNEYVNKFKHDVNVLNKEVVR